MDHAAQLAAIDWQKWSAIGTIIAAVATVILAYVTWGLVKATKGIVEGEAVETSATKQLAEATRVQARTSALALAVQAEPRIVPIHEKPPAFAHAENIGVPVMTHYVRPLLIEVANVGNGVAELTRVEVTVSDLGPTNEVRFPGPLRQGAGAVLVAEYTTPPPKGDSWGGHKWEGLPEVKPGATVSVRVHYRGAGSREYQVAFSWRRTAGPRWELRLLEELGHLSMSAALAELDQASHIPNGD